nr:IS66 family transposase [Burkholderia glumae]
MLEPGRGKTRTARLWTYVRDDRPAGSRAPPAVWYRYSLDREGERPREHLAGYTCQRRIDTPHFRRSNFPQFFI